jgi:cytochrome bd-type quinol oxidase subunit 2
LAYPPRPIRPLPGAPAQDTEEGIRTGLVARIIIVLTIVLGQLWALTVALEAYLSGHTDQAWWLFAFSALSFAVVALLVWIDPPPRADPRRVRRR